VVDEPELHFVRDTEILVPDLAGWRREHMPEIPPDPRCEVVPDWICEVLSPATRRKDREIKPLYARYGVAHAWIIDPGLEILEASELRGAEWAPPAVHGPEDTVASAPFEAAAFRVADLWS
jgi:Uma2 family endonuclease